MKQDDELLKIKNEIVNCHQCSLCQTRKLPVIGQGNHDADIMFIGEAPGANEDKTGFPFCGRAGEILDQLLLSAGLKREAVYIANILKCRPPANRNPEKNEIDACSPYLEKQIKIIQPKLICTMGNFATAFIFKKYGLVDKIQGISKLHGQLQQADKIRILPLYHPAVATYNANMLDILKSDFQQIKKFKI